MGSCMSIYLSNGFGRNHYVNFCILDENFSNFSKIREFQADFKELLNIHKSQSLYKTNLIIYSFSFQFKNVNLILQKAEKYLKQVKSINLIGNKNLFIEIVNHLNTIKFTCKTDYTINHVEEHLLLKDRLNMLAILENFSFSIPPGCVSELFSPQPLETIKEDLIVVLLESGPTYFYVPFDSTIGSFGQEKPITHSRLNETKFIGTSPIGPKTIVSLFKYYIKNFGTFNEEYYKMYDYTFEQILELSKSGNNQVCDVLVSDIYGEWAQVINLTPSLIASKFGKLQAPNLDVLLRDVLDGEGVLEDMKKRLLSPTGTGYSEHQMLLKEMAPKLRRFKDKIVEIEHFSRSLILVIVESIAHHGFLRSLIHKSNKILFVGEACQDPAFCLMVKEKIDYFPGEKECLFSEVCALQPILGCLDDRNS